MNPFDFGEITSYYNRFIPEQWIRQASQTLFHKSLTLNSRNGKLVHRGNFILFRENVSFTSGLRTNVLTHFYTLRGGAVVVHIRQNQFDTYMILIQYNPDYSNSDETCKVVRIIGGSVDRVIIIRLGKKQSGFFL